MPKGKPSWSPVILLGGAVILTIGGAASATANPPVAQHLTSLAKSLDQHNRDAVLSRTDGLRLAQSYNRFTKIKPKDGE
jgi:hypothetical protein